MTKVTNPCAGPGVWSDSQLVRFFKTYLAIKDAGFSSLYCYQGSHNTTVAASAGTHNLANCHDMSPSFDNHLAKKLGYWSEMRETWQGPWVRHAHGVLMYYDGTAWLAEAQWRAYVDHKSSGLGDLDDHLAWGPKYRGVKHLSGPNETLYRTTRETIGWSIAGCHGTNSDDVARYKKVVRQRGYLFTGRAGKVRANGSEYLVTPHLTFYNMANLTTVTA